MSAERTRTGSSRTAAAPATRSAGGLVKPLIVYATAASNGDRPPPNFRMVWRRRDPSRQLFLVPNVKSACSDIAKREIVLAISPSTRVKYPSTGVGYSFRRRLGIAIALIRGDRGC